MAFSLLNLMREENVLQIPNYKERRQNVIFSNNISEMEPELF